MKHLARILCILLCFFSFALAGACAEEKGEKGAVLSLQQEAEAELETELGAFEITAMQRELAKENTAGYPVLDAGRGNPNWINTQSR